MPIFYYQYYFPDAIQNGITLEHLVHSNEYSGTYSPQNGHGVLVSYISSFNGLLAIVSIYFLNFS